MIIEGKRYVLRNGKVTGPLQTAKDCYNKDYVWWRGEVGKRTVWWTTTGLWSTNGEESPLDIVKVYEEDEDRKREWDACIDFLMGHQEHGPATNAPFFLMETDVSGLLERSREHFEARKDAWKKYADEYRKGTRFPKHVEGRGKDTNSKNNTSSIETARKISERIMK